MSKYVPGAFHTSLYIGKARRNVELKQSEPVGLELANAVLYVTASGNDSVTAGDNVLYETGAESRGSASDEPDERSHC
jgi:hypothetical protein